MESEGEKSGAQEAGWVGGGVGWGSHRLRGALACFWCISFCSRFSFSSCFLSLFFFWEMRWSTSTPH